MSITNDRLQELARNRKFLQTKTGLASGKRLPMCERMARIDEAMKRVRAEMHDASRRPLPDFSGIMVREDDGLRHPASPSDACANVSAACAAYLAAAEPIFAVAARYEEMSR